MVSAAVSRLNARLPVTLTFRGLPRYRGLALHQEKIQATGNDEADKPGVVVKPAQGWNHEADQRDRDSRDQCDDGFWIEPTLILIRAAPSIQILHNEATVPHQVII